MTRVTYFGTTERRADTEGDASMVFYRALGQLPQKRHVAFSLPDGRPCFEEFIGEEGFSSSGSLLYHLNVPSSPGRRPRVGAG